MNKGMIHSSGQGKGQAVTSVRASRRLLVRRLREIDQLSAKELAVLMANTERLKAAFRPKR